jgi:hypothetical protein
MNKLTDAEIIKALECCIKETSDCDNCPLYIPADADCINISKSGALDLINRQQADIRKLQLENEKLEIKLKGKIENSNKSRDSAMEVIKKQEAEIERLKASKDKWKEIAIILDQSIRDKDATIEMLEEMVGEE